MAFEKLSALYRNIESADQTSPDGIHFHNAELRQMARATYDETHVAAILDALASKGTFEIHETPGGGFPASTSAEVAAAGSSMRDYWIRDNANILAALRAKADWLEEQTRVHEAAVIWQQVERNITQVFQHWVQISAATIDELLYRAEIRKANELDPERFGEAHGDGLHEEARRLREEPAIVSVEQRPAIKYQKLGEGGEFCPVEEWSNAQNDAWGRMLAEMAHLALHRAQIGEETMEAMCYIVHLLRSLDYAHDEDSGYWEEYLEPSRASSIACVIDGLRWFKKVLQLEQALGMAKEYGVAEADVDELIRQGREMLVARVHKDDEMQMKETDTRGLDGALATILWLSGMDDHFEQQEMLLGGFDLRARIARRVIRDLAGRRGIRRYLADSYFGGFLLEGEFLNFLDKMRGLDNATAALDCDGGEGAQLEDRDCGLVPGWEAQWCAIFDSKIGIAAIQEALCLIDSHQIREAGDLEQMESVIWACFNRCLGQIDADGQIPEMYYVVAAKPCDGVVDLVPDEIAAGWEVRQDGEATFWKLKFEANPHTPLLWGQAAMIEFTVWIERYLAKKKEIFDE